MQLSSNSLDVLSSYLASAPPEVEFALASIKEYVTGTQDAVPVIALLLEEPIARQQPNNVTALLKKLPPEMEMFRAAAKSLVSVRAWTALEQLRQQWLQIMQLREIQFMPLCTACEYKFTNKDVYICPVCQQVRALQRPSVHDLPEGKKGMLAAEVDFGACIRYMRGLKASRDTTAVFEILPRLVVMGQDRSPSLAQGKWVTTAVENVLAIGDWESYLVVLNDYERAMTDIRSNKICGHRLAYCTECGREFSGVYVDDWLCPDCVSVRRLCNVEGNDIMDNGRCKKHNGKEIQSSDARNFYHFRDTRMNAIYQEVVNHEDLMSMIPHMTVLLTRVKELQSIEDNINIGQLSTKIAKQIAAIEKAAGSIEKAIAKGEFHTLPKYVEKVKEVIYAIRDLSDNGNNQLKRWDEMRITIDLVRKLYEAETKKQVAQTKIITFLDYQRDMAMLAELAVQRMAAFLPAEKVDTARRLLARDIEKVQNGEILIRQ